MPVHDFRCPKGHVTEQMVGQGVNHIFCTHCDQVAEKVFLTAPRGYVQPDICYDSPIDGKPITSKHARQEDLRRNGCVEYDPGMRQDADRRRAELDAQLDRAVEETVDEFVATAPTRILEKLDSELRSGVDVEVKRLTPETVH